MVLVFCCSAVLDRQPLTAGLWNVVDATLKWDQSYSGWAGVIMDRIEQGFVVAAWAMIAAATLYLIW